MTTDNNRYYVRLNGFWTGTIVTVFLAAFGGCFLLGRAYFSDAMQAKEETIRRLESTVKSYADAATLNLPKSLETLSSLSTHLDSLVQEVSIEFNSKEKIKKITSDNEKLKLENAKYSKENVELKHLFDAYNAENSVFIIEKNKAKKIIGDLFIVSVKRTFEALSNVDLVISNGQKRTYEKTVYLGYEEIYEDSIQRCSIVVTAIKYNKAEFTLSCSKK